MKSYICSANRKRTKPDMEFRCNEALLCLVLILGICSRTVSADCSPCVCTGNTMQCKFKNLREIPTYIPYDTVTLGLLRNNIPVLKNDSFITLQKLEHLHLTSNAIETIEPTAFRGLSQLRTLKLDENKIASLPSRVFSYLTRLEELDLSSTYITYLSPEAFVNLNALTLINLQTNGISELRREVFSNMPSLQTLQMNDNILLNVREGTFQDLANLRTLDLSNNEIETFAANAFSNSSIVRKIDLSGSNRITHLHGDTFRNLQKLEDLRLNGNPFMCSCELYDFRAWMQTVVSVKWFQDNLPVCSLPEDRKGLNLFQIEVTSFVCTTTVPTTTTVTTTTETPTTTTTTMATTTMAEITSVVDKNKNTMKIVNTPSGTTWYFRPPTSAASTLLDSDFLPIVIGCSCAAFVIIIIIIVLCVCCRKCTRKQKDSGIYKVRENTITHDHVRPPSQVRFENEKNSKTDSKMQNGHLTSDPPNGHLPSEMVNKENDNATDKKLHNGHLSDNKNESLPNGNGHIHNGFLPNHVAKKNLLNEYSNCSFPPEVINTGYTPDSIFHTESSLKTSPTPLNHSNNPDYSKNIANLKHDYDHKPDISYNPGGSSLDEIDMRPPQRSSSHSSPTFNSSSGLLPAWDYPPLQENYEPSLCSQSSSTSKKIRTETYV